MKALLSLLWACSIALASAQNVWHSIPNGQVLLTPNHASIVQFEDSDFPARQELLNESASAYFHNPSHYWGNGAIVTTAGSGA